MTKSTTYYWVLAALMSVITLIASYVVVPFGVIPFTLQTMAVVLTGLLIPTNEELMIARDVESLR